MWPPRGSPYLKTTVGQQWGSKTSNTSQWGTYGIKLRSCKNLPKRDYKRLLLLHSGNDADVDAAFFSVVADVTPALVGHRLNGNIAAAGVGVVLPLV